MREKLLSDDQIEDIDYEEINETKLTKEEIRQEFDMERYKSRYDVLQMRNYIKDQIKFTCEDLRALQGVKSFDSELKESIIFLKKRRNWLNQLLIDPVSSKSEVETITKAPGYPDIQKWTNPSKKA